MQNIMLRHIQRATYVKKIKGILLKGDSRQAIRILLFLTVLLISLECFELHRVKFSGFQQIKE